MPLSSQAVKLVKFKKGAFRGIVPKIRSKVPFVSFGDPTGGRTNYGTNFLTDYSDPYQGDRHGQLFHPDAECNEFVEITRQVRKIVEISGVKEGICMVYCPHTTAGITINENADPDVVHDVLAWLGRAIPKEQADFRYAEGNSDSHLKSILVGTNSNPVIVNQGDLVLGQWQGIYFCEFDGPRTGRTVQVQILG